MEKKIKNYRVRHHDHATGKFIGPAHLMCNLTCHIPKFVPIFAHNASRYDNHFIVNYLYLLGDGDIKVVPKNDEEYISILKMITLDNGDRIEIRFLDSCLFMMATSLDELGTNLLRKGKSYFNNILSNTSDIEKSVIFWTETKT